MAGVVGPISSSGVGSAGRRHTAGSASIGSSVGPILALLRGRRRSFGREINLRGPMSQVRLDRGDGRL